MRRVVLIGRTVGAIEKFRGIYNRCIEVAVLGNILYIAALRH